MADAVGGVNTQTNNAATQDTGAGFEGAAAKAAQGMDRAVTAAKADQGLQANAPKREEGFAAMEGLNKMIVGVADSKGLLADGNISEDDVRAIHDEIANDKALFAEFARLHGDDEGNGEETGYHTIQNNGNTTQWDGAEAFTTRMDSLYHIGFGLEGDTFVNEDGTANAKVSDMATYLNQLMFGNAQFA